ncbi:MAG: hypothetical protein HN742_14575 [Lentisphaerae bacterium]|nr:hypothetical protein [Lentisphaerota bacterium]MBT4822309.1 hypothetical protein [Lentisphaerota bacterium]MBT5606822.1 hypothetical protein [Lentisphaerota bacterium]MBT7055764.1 hypothetical protein [Lentisphaerota bacterium]MBT7843101.1 hypothetical protein [Lentisphaerota bacterium]
MRHCLLILLVIGTGLNLPAVEYVSPAYVRSATWAEGLRKTREQVRQYEAWRRETANKLRLDTLTMSSWQTVGWHSRNVPKSFDNDTWEPGIEAYFQREKSLSRGAKIAGRQLHDCHWREGTTLSSRNRVGNHKGVDYYHRVITSPEARPLTLHLGFTHCLRVWHNGTRVFSETVEPRPCRPNSERVTLQLRNGENHILVRASDGYRQRHGAAIHVSHMPRPARADSAALLRPAFAAYPVESDWALQDGFGMETWLNQNGQAGAEAAAITRVLDELGERGNELRPGLKALSDGGVSTDDPRWLELYLQACRLRRDHRLAPLRKQSPDIVFIKRRPVSPSFFAYTEGQSDAQHERHFSPGTSLCVMHLRPEGSTVETLVSAPKGVIRDVDVSYDGKRILFAWKKADRSDDYHLYELDADGGEPRQLTSGLGFADYEGVYLPNDDIAFSSSRCVQTVDCWWTEVSNLYTCAGDGRFLRRLGFDQVHTISPKVLADGSVLYTRWDYNDRGQIYPQGLFRMNADGTGQTEYYGNNSYFPTTTSHARGIPGTSKVVAVAMGHHTWQAGKLIEIDPGLGRQEAEGVQYLAPRRPAKAVRVDAFGQSGELFRHPYPLGNDEFLVAYVPAAMNRGRSSVFGIYHIDADGRRELLAHDASVSANHPIPLRPRPRPHQRPSVVDYRKDTGTYYVQDVYHGPGLRGIPRGTVDRLRVIALDFRAAGVKSNGNRGPAGGALVSTPIAIPNGAWDVKRVIGDATVYADGSAFLEAPARTPLYFQALDKNGNAVQTMRSWSTLQPGEAFSCVGCHEPKNEAPPSAHKPSLAMAHGPQELKPFYGPPRGFSFAREIQPMLDRHCIRCHGSTGGGAGGTVPSASHCNPSDSATAMCDGVIPKNSDDHSIRRHTWWSRKGGAEWAQLTFPKPKAFSVLQVYWFDDRPRGGRCRVPESWRLMYLDGDAWREVRNASVYGVERDTFNTTRFAPVATTALRIEAKMRKDVSGGILELRYGATDGELERKPRLALDLTGHTKPGGGGRRWSRSYLALTNHGKGSRLVNWISAQSVPSMLEPYHKGAAKSELITMLRKGHKRVVLGRSEIDRLACWVDLLVPYCGDYREANAWSDEEKVKYARYLNKRRGMEALERANVEAYIRHTTGVTHRVSEGYRNVALNPLAIRAEEGCFPRATSNSECRGEACFAALNVINGDRRNRGHGPKFPSWGPDKREDAWLKIEFGGDVEVDRMDLYIRADFPHDRHWHKGTIVFSDGSREAISIRKTGDVQRFSFTRRRVSWLTLVELTQAGPPGWCALSEVEVYGRDLPPDVAME